MENEKRHAFKALEGLGLDVPAMAGAGLRELRMICGVDKAAAAMAAPGGLLISQRGDVYLVGTLETEGRAGC